MQGRGRPGSLEPQTHQNICTTFPFLSLGIPYDHAPALCDVAACAHGYEVLGFPLHGSMGPMARLSHPATSLGHELRNVVARLREPDPANPTRGTNTPESRCWRWEKERWKNSR